MQSAELAVQSRNGDLDFCRALMRQGSKSFYAASRLLPARVESSIAPLYAFCRVADDLIDEVANPNESLEMLHNRLDAIYRGEPWSLPVDRAFFHVVHEVGLPRTLTDALLEGFAWEVEGRRYSTISEVRSYSARVASSVGVMATLIMGRRDPETLARAADLGVAMQLTNIARDVGEDASRNRLYLPTDWLMEEGVDIDRWLARPRSIGGVARVVCRLLEHASALYARAEQGIPNLPMDCRIAIEAARLIYADIGRVVAESNYDSVTRRAVTSRARKVWLGLRASIVMSKSVVHRPPVGALPEAAFLVDAVSAPDRLTNAVALP